MEKCSSKNFSTFGASLKAIDYVPSQFQAIENFSLSNAQLCESGKFEMLDKMLPNMQEADARVLLFTQFTMVLDVMEVRYIIIRL